MLWLQQQEQFTRAQVSGLALSPIGSIVQRSGHRSSKPATRVRIPLDPQTKYGYPLHMVLTQVMHLVTNPAEGICCERCGGKSMFKLKNHKWTDKEEVFLNPPKGFIRCDTPASEMLP